jgi:hypothetical protein
MKLIPFERFSVESRLTKDQVKDRLNKRIGTNRVNNFERPEPKYFSGTVTGDKFEIYPILENKRNAWGPLLFGIIDETRTGTIVRVKMRPRYFVLLFTMAGGLMGYINSPDEVLTIQSLNLEIGINFVPILIAYAICTGFFHSDTGTCKDYLIEITEGVLK